MDYQKITAVAQEKAEIYADNLCPRESPMWGTLCRNKKAELFCLMTTPPHKTDRQVLEEILHELKIMNAQKG